MSVGAGPGKVPYLCGRPRWPCSLGGWLALRGAKESSPGPCAEPWAMARQLPLGRVVRGRPQPQPLPAVGVPGGAGVGPGPPGNGRSPKSVWLHPSLRSLTPSTTAGGQGKGCHVGSWGPWCGLQPQKEKRGGKQPVLQPCPLGAPRCRSIPSRKTGTVAGTSCPGGQYRL